MPSFDVVSQVDWSEIDNALNQAKKELAQRFDFKGTNTSIKVSEGTLVLESADDFKIKSAYDVLQAKLAKRKVPLGALSPSQVQPASGGRARQEIIVKSGIDPDAARKIVKAIKGTKIKVQAAIQGDSLRISGKKRDDLQDVMTALKSNDFGQPLQFENMRD